MELYNRTVPKIHHGTMVKSEFVIRQFGGENIAKTVPNEVSELFLCPICGSKFEKYDRVLDHLHFWHKIPEEHRLRLRLDIIVKKV